MAHAPESTWAGFNPHGQLVPFGGTKGPGELPRYSHFTQEQRIEVGRALKVLHDLADPTDTEVSALTDRIITRFGQTMERGKLPNFTNIVFMSVLDLLTYAVDTHPESRYATRFMLEAAGAEGIGAVVNGVTDYLRTAYTAYQADTQPGFYVVNPDFFTRPHRIISISPWEETYIEAEEVPAEYSEDYFNVHCLGQVFSEKVEKSIAQAAILLIYGDDPVSMSLRELIGQHEQYILGPRENPEIFFNRWGMVERALAHIRSLTPDIPVSEEE